MQILDQLKQQGYRLTKPREEVLKTLSGYPRTVQEIYEVLRKKHQSVDLASVYRTLDLFVDLGVIYSIELGEGKKRYELVNKENHHHHLVCNHCGTIKDIEINEYILNKELKKHTSFKVDHHQLEFFGLCAKCQ